MSFYKFINFAQRFLSYTYRDTFYSRKSSKRENYGLIHISQRAYIISTIVFEQFELAHKQNPRFASSTNYTLLFTFFQQIIKQNCIYAKQTLRFFVFKQVNFYVFMSYGMFHSCSFLYISI